MFQLSPILHRKTEAGCHCRTCRTIQPQIWSQDRSLAGLQPSIGCRGRPVASFADCFLNRNQEQTQCERRSGGRQPFFFVCAVVIQLSEPNQSSKMWVVGMREDQIIVGGQAVIEGVMMRAPHSYAVAVRRPDGQIVSKAERLPALSETYPVLKLPVLRGSAVLIQSMLLGIKSLNFSANVVFHEAESEAPAPQAQVETAGVGRMVMSANNGVVTIAKLEAEPEAKSSAVAAGAVGSIAFAILFNILLFIVLPLLLTNMLFVYFGGGTIDVHSASGTWYANAWAWIRAALH